MKIIGYESETSKFLREYLDKNPQVRELQKKNRATWWDKPQDLETNRERAAASVPQPGYVYFPLPQKKRDDPGSDADVKNPARAP